MCCEAIVNTQFDVRCLAAAYDRGCLVPFIGSGMSVPACPDWSGFVSRLENSAGISTPMHMNQYLIQRALLAQKTLRQQGRDEAGEIAAAIYLHENDAIPTQTQLLASVFWPLVCTTNYDDLYLRAKLSILGDKQKLPEVLGRSEVDCRRVLQHLSFPASEVLWALQGFLGLRREQTLRKLTASRGVADDHPLRQSNLMDELVVGHAEYRKAAHRAPHFRRSFAELFRTRSLFFLGSGLAEPYFLTLFDEIIELTGPPVRPHFAVIEEGKVDAEFLREQYHIVCNTYSGSKHGYVADLLEEFGAFVIGPRARESKWTFRVYTPTRAQKSDVPDHFSIVRATPPLPEELADGEVVAVSCGRGLAEATLSGEERRGRPLVGDGKKILRLQDNECDWLDDWTVQWKNRPRSYGIVARELIDPDESRISLETSRDRRSPDAIRKAFTAFLHQMIRKNTRVAHVQLLAAGKHSVFHPWVAVVQMARAYGEWCADRMKICKDGTLLVRLYVVHPGVVSLLQGGYINIAEQLDCTAVRIMIETIDRNGRSDRHHRIIGNNTKLRTLTGSPLSRNAPHVYTYPISRLNTGPMLLTDEIADLDVRDFGLFSDSVLIIDYRSADQVTGVQC